jgi:hypothetical protein
VNQRKNDDQHQFLKIQLNQRYFVFAFFLISGTAVKEMQERFPGQPVPDLIRFLVARKGNVDNAAEMLSKSLAWRASNLPLKRTAEVVAALKTGCFFPHGV